MPSDTWTTPADWTTNEVVTAAKLNQQVRDDLYALWLTFTSSSAAITPATRTRRVTMAPLNVLTALDLNFLDGSVTQIAFFGLIPDDYVSGTNITLRWLVRPRATGNVLWNAYVYVHANGETFGTRTVYNATSDVQAVVNNVVELIPTTSLTINGTTYSLAVGDAIYFAENRNGGHASDTAAGAMDTFAVWFEYTGRNLS